MNNLHNFISPTSQKSQILRLHLPKAFSHGKAFVPSYRCHRPTRSFCRSDYLDRHIQKVVLFSFSSHDPCATASSALYFGASQDNFHNQFFQANQEPEKTRAIIQKSPWQPESGRSHILVFEIQQLFLGTHLQKSSDIDNPP